MTQDQRDPNEAKQVFQRLFLLRHRLLVSLPEDLATLKKRVLEAGKSNPPEWGTGPTLFYSVGLAMSARAEPMTMGEVSRSLAVPLSSATRIVSWMVDFGYAQRLPDPNDRRVVRVALTQDGAALFRGIDEFFMERIQRLMRTFTPEESKTFLGLLSKIADTLEQEA
jgi:DNA-binding MarR family transcriptional regulator